MQANRLIRYKNLSKCPDFSLLISENYDLKFIQEIFFVLIFKDVNRTTCSDRGWNSIPNLDTLVRYVCGGDEMNLPGVDVF